MVDSVKSWKRLLISLVIALITNVGIWAIVVILPAIETEFNSGRGSTTFTLHSNTCWFCNRKFSHRTSGR